MEMLPLMLICLFKSTVSLNTLIDEPLHPIYLKLQNAELIGQRIQTLESTLVDQYLSIPYAKPPLGDLRFHPPVPIDQLNGKLDVSSEPPSCSQIRNPDFFGLVYSNFTSEDCLYISIFIPSKAKKSLPVFLIIPEGGFEEGSTSDKNLAMNIAGQFQVIVATMQYRVGALGLLYLGLQEAPGNMAMLDQQLAMKWVRDNIAAFRGDPERITIMGVSAGAISSSYHLLAPGSRGLFHRAIISSGTTRGASVFIPPEEMLKLSQKLISELSCDGSSVKESLECLKTRDAMDIVKAQKASSLSFKPTIDKNFLHHPPKYYFDNDLTYKVPIMQGVAKSEGEYLLWLQMPEIMEAVRPELSDEVTFLMIRADWNYTDDFVHFVKNYFRIILQKENGKDPDNLDILLRISGDAIITCSILEDVYHYANKLPDQTFMYVFDVKTEAVKVPDWMRATHATDWTIVFERFHAGNEDMEGFNIQKRVLKHWMNFVETGDPNYDSEGHKVADEWKPVGNGDKRVYLHIDRREPWQHGYNFNKATCDFLGCVDPDDNTPEKSDCSKFKQMPDYIESKAFKRIEL